LASSKTGESQISGTKINNGNQEIRMKFLQYAFCGFALTLTAAAQTTPASPSAAPSQSANTPATTPKITNLDGEEVKGPEHPLTLDQMKVLYVAMGYEKTIGENLEKMITTQKQRAAFIPDDFWADLDSSFKKIDYPTALLDVYKKYISTEDADKLIAFSKTEAGKHFFETLPETSREVTAAIQKQQQTTGVQVQARHKDEIDAALKKYREEHAPKPAPTLGAPTPGAPAGSSAPAATPAPTTAPAKPPTTTPQN
jgi:uncharacterized protein